MTALLTQGLRELGLDESRAGTLERFAALLLEKNEVMNLTAITFCFLAASSIRRPLPRWLAQVDRASFLIYLYHALAISALDKILERTDITGAFAPYLIRIVTAFTLVPLGCVIWQRTWGAIRRNGSEKNRSGESV